MREDRNQLSGEAMGKISDMTGQPPRTPLPPESAQQSAEESVASNPHLRDKFFGIWQGTDACCGMDGLAWQEKMRAEWDVPFSESA